MSLTPAKVSSGRCFFEGIFYIYLYIFCVLGCASLRGKRWRRQSREKEAASMASRPLKFPEIDDELRKIIDANLDEVPARKLAREAFKDIQLGIDHILFKTPCDGLKMKESYEVNSRGLEIFTKSWLPKSSSPKAVALFSGIARKLASSGYGFFAMDYPGYGMSEGLHGYIPSFDRLVDDVIEHYSKVKENPEFRTLPSFLFGESLGGAVALKVHLKQPNAWNGAILVAPMCKAAYNVIAYKDKPRLKTALEMLRTTQEIERRLEQVSLPLLILHGEADIVTDPSVSKLLYEKACSSDKKLKLYKDAFHALLEGEPDEVILQVFKDTISWLDEHSRETNSC
ncbi:hypothetical protein SADUNF_Sadunf17G0108000 [Salix dunnii]|uniref:Serine aminopeptidase S33 domain-containing protein n=1 Tax=Salix dunnii TaxID=1413687 RepID=A0A835J6L0_9ROSI|nr:hypothetical protein SADUNF_Sadunf17G0108000 [Salix dunnii]